MLRRRPNRSPDGRIDGGGATGAAPRLAGGVLGGLAGAGLGQFLALPTWAGAAALTVSVVAVVLLALRDWTRAVDDWWARADPEEAGRILRETHALVVTTAVHDWLFAEVRHHCSAGAGAVARLLRGLAETADGYGGAQVQEWDTWADEPPEPAPKQGPVGGPDTTAAAWSWDDWGDGADDAWSDLDDAPPVRSSAASPYPPPSPAFSEDPAHSVGPAHSFDPSTFADQPSSAYPPSSTYPSSPSRPAPGAAADMPGGLPSGPAPAWLERRYGDGGPALVDTLVGDLVAGTVLILDGCWAGIERDPGGAERVARAAQGQRLTELLDETRLRLERDVAASAPPPYEGLRDLGAFTSLAAFTDRSERPDAARLTGVAPDAVARLLLADDDPGGTVALCGPEHLRLLSHDPLAARQVRFVPEAMRRGAAGDDIWRGTAEDVVWTGAGRHAGILRLVPLRADVVHTVRAEEAGEP